MAIIAIEDWIEDWESITCMNCVNDIMPILEKEEIVLRREICETPLNKNNGLKN